VARTPCHRRRTSLAREQARPSAHRVRPGVVQGEAAPRGAGELAGARRGEEARDGVRVEHPPRAETERRPLDRQEPLRGADLEDRAREEADKAIEKGREKLGEFLKR